VSVFISDHLVVLVGVGVEGSEGARTRVDSDGSRPMAAAAIVATELPRRLIDDLIEWAIRSDLRARWCAQRLGLGSRRVV
jgi:hypothetical protein